MRNNEAEDLKNIRQEIDILDDNIHTNIIKRWPLIEKVIQAKKAENKTNNATPAHTIRFARECEIFSRLQKKHQPPFPFSTIRHIWHEMIAAYTLLQQKYSLVVMRPVLSSNDEAKNLSNLEDFYILKQTIKSQFGHASMIELCDDFADILKVIGTDKTKLAVIEQAVDASPPSPPWWYHLAQYNRKISQNLDHVHVVHKLYQHEELRITSSNSTYTEYIVLSQGDLPLSSCENMQHMGIFSIELKEYGQEIFEKLQKHGISTLSSFSAGGAHFLYAEKPVFFEESESHHAISQNIIENSIKDIADEFADIIAIDILGVYISEKGMKEHA